MLDSLASASPRAAAFRREPPRSTTGRSLRAAVPLTGVLVVCAYSALLALGAGAAHAGPQWPPLRDWQKQGGGDKDAALIAVVEKYAFVPGVPGARSSGEDWFKYLRQTRGVALDRVTILRDEEVTKENLLAKAAEAAKDVGEGGTLWFVFVGHGAAAEDGSEGVLIGADAQQTATSLFARSVGQGALLGKLAGSKAARIVAVLDSCFSGRSSTGEALGKGLQPLQLTRQADALDPRLVVLTAAGANEFAGALPGAERPAFSYLVLGGLRGWADLDGNGEVTGAELAAYSSTALRALLGGSRKQTPTVEGVKTASLGRGWEKGPDLDAMVLQKPPAEAARGPVEVAAPKVELPGVPVLGGTLGGGVVIGADLDALEAYEQAVTAEKAGTARASANAWAKLASLGGKNPYQGDAASRAAQWKARADVMEKLEVEAPDAFAKLARYLKLKMLPVEQKKALVADFKARFGALASWAAKVEALEERGNAPTVLGMVIIPGGTYTSRADIVTVGSFRLDQTEITVAAYEVCVKAATCSDPGKGGRCNWGVSGRGNHPINCVTWGEANAYCQAQRKRLPTEEEWEWAARGAKEGRAFPWGNAAPAMRRVCWNQKGTCEVSSHRAGQSKHGVDDLAGNVWEWTSSEWDAGGPLHVIRGGSWRDDEPGNMRAKHRNGHMDSRRDDFVGFRCAKSAQ